MSAGACEDFILGLDIGGTKLAAGIATSSGRLIKAGRVPTRVKAGPDTVIADLIALGRRMVDESGVPWSEVKAVGVGCGGPLDLRAGLVQAPATLPDWVDVPLTQILGDAFGLPVYLDNDANAAGLAEYLFGAGRGVEDMIYMTISTGIGGGVILGGRLLHGRNDNAGELGHTSVHYDGRLCGCGRKGCLQAYASGTAIAERAREAVLSGEPSSLLKPGGLPERITSETVVAAVRQGDALATRIWEETMLILGTGIANVVNALNPQVVVLGGGVTSVGDLLFEPVRRIVFSQVFEAQARDLRIVPAQLGNEVGVLGAVAAALQHLPSGRSTM